MKYQLDSTLLHLGERSLQGIDERLFDDVCNMPLEEMSRNALQSFTLNGMENIYKSCGELSKVENKIAVVHQPDFMPYLGFFDRLLKSDIYVIFDNVQFVRSSRGWTSRDKIKTANGEKWITVGSKKAPRDTPINQIFLSEDFSWKELHLNLFKENYRRSGFFDEIMPYIEKLYDFHCERMMDFNMESIKMLMNLLDIHIDMVFASDLNPQGKNNTLIVDILKKLGIHKYLSGIGARDYYDPVPYEEAGIEVIWQDFKHPIYSQQHGGFIPYLSSIDLLFNCGIEQSRRIIRQC